MRRKLLPIALVVGIALEAGAAHAQRAAYASPDALAPEGLPHALDLAMLAAYSHVGGSDKTGELANAGDLRLRSRVGVGRTLGYFGGLDAALGVSDAGVVYDITGYLLGGGMRWGPGNAVFASGGIGLDRFGSVPSAAKLPVEVSAAMVVGPVRPTVWVRPTWILGEARRRDGSSFSFVDELEAGVLVRVGRQYRYWSTTSAGGGLGVGLAYREFMGTYAVTALVGLAFEGER